jgi:hypothetical protein
LKIRVSPVRTWVSPPYSKSISRFQSLIPSGIFFWVKNIQSNKNVMNYIDYWAEIRLNTRHWRDSSVGRATD